MVLDTNKVVMLLCNIPRRGGLQNEGQHAIKVLLKVKQLTRGITDINKACLNDLAIIHDVKEVMDNETADKIISSYSLDVQYGVGILTREKGESSKQHFERVLNCGVKEVLYVKIADCLVNAEYTQAEAQWHYNTFKTSHKKERIKYLTRVGKLTEELNSI